MEYHPGSIELQYITATSASNACRRLRSVQCSLLPGARDIGFDPERTNALACAFANRFIWLANLLFTTLASPLKLLLESDSKPKLNGAVSTEMLPAA